jgi:hypothetical protein
MRADPRRARRHTRSPNGRADLVVQIGSAADPLASVLAAAADLDLATPPAVSNAIHGLRGWAARLQHAPTTRPTQINAARLIAYLRDLPDHQLLALLADLPWSRLDTLLDAVSTPQPTRTPTANRQHQHRPRPTHLPTPNPPP